MPPMALLAPKLFQKRFTMSVAPRFAAWTPRNWDVADVIFDHRTMKIHCLVMDSGGWLAAFTIATLGRSAFKRKRKPMIVRCNTSSANVSHPSFVGPYCRTFNG
jgi:hypothetical protein